MLSLSSQQISQWPLPRDPQISPDGQWVVFVQAPLGKAETQSKSSLWIAPSNASSPPRQLSAGLAADHTPRWSPNSQEIAFLSDRAKSGVAQLYRLSLQGGEALPLTQGYGAAIETFAWSPDGRYIAFASADDPTPEQQERQKSRQDAKVWGQDWPYARLRVLEVGTGQTHTLVQEAFHVAELAWSPDSSALAFIAWPYPTLEGRGEGVAFYRVALRHPEIKELGRFAGGASSLLWPQPEQLLFLGPYSQQPQSASSVWQLSVQGGVPTHMAFGSQSCAIGLQQHQNQTVVAVASGMESQLVVLEASGQSRVFFSTQGFALHDWSGCETALTAVCSSAHEPWAVWAGSVEHFKPLQHPEVPANLAQQKPFVFQTRDGLTLDGLLLHPDGDGPWPTLVLPHGGPYGRVSHSFQVGFGAWGQWLAQAGFAVLLPNYRGGLGRGEAFAAMARGGVGGLELNDLLDAIDAAIAQGVADPERLGIGGWSQGGFLAAWAITQTQRFKAAVVGAGVTDWGMLVSTTDVPQFEIALGGSAPWDGPQAPHLQASPIAFAGQAQTPTLLLHGENDARVPLSQAVGFHRALRAAGVLCELVVYPREPHGLQEQNHQQDALERVREWFLRWV